MDRLTAIIDGWVHLVDPENCMDISELRAYCNNECKEKGCVVEVTLDEEPHCADCDCIVNWFYQSFVRLAEYEETGLTSKEVAQLLKEKQERENPEMLTVVATLPLDDGTEFIANVELVNDYKVIYSELCIEEQFLKMRGWLLANPNKRKNKVSVLRFINTWLSYEDKARKKSEAENKIFRSSQIDSGGVKVKAGVMNNFSQELPDFEKITKNIVEKQSCCTR